MRILIVEDEPAAGELIQMYLSDYGQCDLAANGKEALAMVENAIACGRPYDLACMDVMMPEMDGMEALKLIRRLEFRYFDDGLAGMKIIMITAKDTAADITAACRSGAEGYISKPFTRKQLLQQLEKLGLFNEPDSADNDADTEVRL